MHLKIFVCFVFLQCSVEAALYEESATDFSRCRKYETLDDTYDDFFQLTERDRNHGEVDFHFSVLTSRDAHILLAPFANVTEEDPAYEIVLGAGKNTYCTIRRLIKGDDKIIVNFHNVVSSTEFRSFWIHISEGAISVGKEGDKKDFMSWTDPEPLSVTVFSFSSWSDIESTWYFECNTGISINCGTIRNIFFVAVLTTIIQNLS